MENNPEMLQLLKKIQRANRWTAGINAVTCLCMLIAAAGCVALCVTIWNLLPQIHGIMQQMQLILGNLEQTSTDLAAMDLEAMVGNVDSLAVFAQESLRQTMEMACVILVEGVEAEEASLNKAIEDLSKVIEPLARFASVFG